MRAILHHALLLAGLWSALQAQAVTFSDFNGVNGVIPGTFLNRMGVSAVRLDVAWRDVELVSGAYDWSSADRKIREAQRSGMQVLPLLAYAPRLNQQIPGRIGSPPVDYAAWLRFVDAVVQRYAAAPWNIEYFQIWNEPTRRAGFWLGDNNTFIYRIYIPAAKIVRAHGKKVVFGGWPASNTISEFCQLLSESRAIDYTDILDFHYGSEVRYDTLYEQFVKTGRVRGIWQTEVGYEVASQALLRVYLRSLKWALEHQWDRADKYRIFWYPAWESRKVQYHGLTTTRSGQFVLTDKGQQLSLLNALYGHGDLVSLPVDSNVQTSLSADRYVFGTRVGQNHVVIAVSVDADYPQSQFTFTVPEKKVPKHTWLIIPGKDARRLAFAPSASELHFSVPSSDIPLKPGEPRKIFFIEYDVGTVMDQ